MLRTGPTTTDLKAVERRIVRIDDSRRNLIRQLAAFDDPDAAAAVRAEIESLGRQRKQLDTERNTLLAQRSVWEHAGEYLADLESWIATVAETLDEITYEQRRGLVEWFGFKATV